MKHALPCLIALIAIILLSFAALADSDIRTPSDKESRAAYCLGVLKDWRNSSMSLRYHDFDKAAGEQYEEKEKLKDDIKRLESYVLPRQRYVDIHSLHLAEARGRKDLKTLQNSDLFFDCSNFCALQENRDKPDCKQDCVEKDDLYKRVTSCRDLDFLPY